MDAKERLIAIIDAWEWDDSPQPEGYEPNHDLADRIVAEGLLAPEAEGDSLKAFLCGDKGYFILRGSRVTWDDVACRLASRPAAESVVSREAIEGAALKADQAYRQTKGVRVWTNLDHAIFDAIFALQLPAPQPSRENVVRGIKPRTKEQYLEAMLTWISDATGDGYSEEQLEDAKVYAFELEALDAKAISLPPVTEPEGEAVEAAIKAWDYMKDRISGVLRGVPVRDLDEAMVAMDSTLAALKELPK